MATNDEIRLKLTVSKMNVHRSTRLETIAAQRIVRNLDSKHSDTRNVMLLPSALRNIVLQQWLTKHIAELKKPKKRPRSYRDWVVIFVKRKRVLQSLVTCHTLEVDLTPFINESFNFLARKHLLEYLKLFGDKATNLKVLIILETVHENPSELNRTLCNAIVKFRNLISLNIRNIYIKYTNLKALCKNLKSLTQLYTQIYFDPSFDESNEREIEELQIFSNLIFFDTNVIDEKFTLNCIQHLPKLQFIDYCTTSIVEQLLDRCPNQKFALTRMELSVRSINKEIHLNFPDMNDLVVHYRRNDNFIPNSLPKFSKIENLSLSFLPSVDRVIQFLDAYGHGLHSLRLFCCEGRFKLSSILDRCPKLESLFLWLFSILPECSRPNIHSFSTGLKELEWHLRLGDQAPLILDILSVPTLECVTLEMSCENFHLEDFEKLTAMILGNLRRLEIIVDKMQRDINYRVFRTLSDFVKSASSFLPHLTHLNIEILSSAQFEINSEVISEIATLQKFIDVYEN